MKLHYFLLDNTKDWPHSGLTVDKKTSSHEPHANWSVDNLLSHFDEFSYTNFYNVNKVDIIEPHAYKFILNFLHMPGINKFVCSTDAKNLLRNDPRCFLVLMSCLEYHIDAEGLRKYLDFLEIPAEKVIVLCSNVECHNHVINGVLYICINFWESYSRFHHKLLPTSPVANIAKMRKNIKNARRKFLCLNRNVKPHRIWLYYAMVKQDMLEQGHVSYHLPKLNVKDYNMLCSGDWVLKRIPPKLHDDFKLVNARKMYPRLLDRLDHVSIINYGNEISAYYADSLVSIVTESDATKNFLTEKTYKAIANLHPFFIIGNPDQHTVLRSRGYYTFEEMFGVDVVEDYESAVQMLTHLKNTEISALKRNIEKNYLDKLVHNHNNFFKRKITWTTIVQEILNATERK